MYKITTVIALIANTVLSSLAYADEAKSLDASSATVEEDVVPIEITLFPPLSIFPSDSKVIKGVSVNLVWGTAASVYGLEVGGILNYANKNGLGLRIAGAVNYAGGNAEGAQIAGLVNYAGKGGSGFRLAGLVNASGWSANGIQVAGLLNMAKDDASGLSFSGVGNLAEGNAYGLHITGFLNHAMKTAAGLRVAGFFNWDNSSIDEIGLFASAFARNGEAGSTDRFSIRHNATGKAAGIQIAGLGNSAMHLDGIQVSALVNRAFRRARGAQFGGLVNYAGDLTGVQVGLVNVARDVGGFQIGFVNVARRLKGIQIGLLNVAYENSLPFMVFVNAGFSDLPIEPTGAPAPGDYDAAIQWKR
jgi:hypothetical protein